MHSTPKLWLAAPLTLGLVVAACSGDDGSDATAEPTDPPATAAAESTEQADSDAGENTEAGAGSATAAGSITLGAEEIALASVLCYFEEQPRAGLGGVFTHTAQAKGTNAEGEDVLLDLTRARGEDGAVEDDIIVDIGDPFGDDMVSLMANGAEGLIDFGEASASVEGVEVSEFGADPVALTFNVACG